MSEGGSMITRRFFSVQFALLRFLGLGWWHYSDEDNTDNFPGLYLYYSILTEIVWVVGFVGLESIDPFIGEKDLDRFMFSLSFVITHDLTVIKLYIFFFKNREIQDIVRILEVDMQQFYQNNKKIRKTIRLTKILTFLFIFFGWLTICNTSIYGIVQDIHWKAKYTQLNNTSLRPFRTLPQPVYIPWNYQADSSYIATFFLETVALLWTGHIVMTIDTFIGALIIHMSLQFSIMQEAISTAYDRTMVKLAESIITDELLVAENSENMSDETRLERIVRTYRTEQEIETALENTFKSCIRQHQTLINPKLEVKKEVMSEGGSPIPRRYFTIQYSLMRFLGLGWWHYSDEGNTNNFPGLYLYYSIITEIVWVFGFVSLESIDPFIGDLDLDRFMINLSFVITHDLTAIKLYIFFFKNRDIQEIVRILEIDLQEFYQNEEKIRKIVRLTRILTSLFLFFGCLTIINTSIYGIVQDVQWKAKVAKLNDTSLRPYRTLPQPIYIPWNYQEELSFITTFILESVALLWTGHIVMTIDTFIGALILHMSLQFSIMQEAISTAYDRTMTKLAEGIDTDNLLVAENSDSISEENRIETLVRTYRTEQEIETALENTFKSCIRQHQILISCVEKFASTYSYGFMTQLLSSLAATCVIMVQLSQDASSLFSIRLMTSLAFFTVMIIQLAIQCFTGNELTYQAQRVGEAVMFCKWERIPPRLRGNLVLMMLRSQRPLILTAAGYANMNNDCFLAIMKAAYSYYAVLSQTQSNI